MQIPTPPTEKEKYLYIDAPKLGLYIGGILSMLTLTTGMFLFSFQSVYFLPYILFPLIVLFYLSISYFIGIFGGVFKKEELLKFNEQDLTRTIDVYLPSCGEEREIIKNTLIHAKKLEWKNINFYVLDDSKDPEHNKWLEDLSKSLEFNYISRENKGELKKAGNIRNAFKQTHGEFFLILDADFTPRHDMLLEMIPYMRDEKVAIVQTPQFFEIKEDDTSIQKGAAYVQELFYRLIQVNRQKWNGSICVGTCALYRRSALAHRGGTAPIEFSEDVHTGFGAICDGYKLKYIPLNLSKGVCPDQSVAYIVQQYRWATGSFSLFLKKDFWKAPIGVMTKMTYLSGMLYYITTGVGVFITPLPGIIMLLFFPERIVYFNLLFTLPSFIYGTVSLAIWSRAKWGLYALEARQLSYWSHILAIYDRLRNKTIGWVATGTKEVGSSSKQIYRRFYVMFVSWAIISISANVILTSYHIYSGMNWINFIPNIFNNTLTILTSWLIFRNLK